MNRITFLIDGFNVYHSIKDAIRDTGGASLRWLDLRSLCDAYVHDFFGPGFALERACYFSALAYHLKPWKPQVVERHRTYIRALESVDVEVNLARFKRRSLRCDCCGGRFMRHEEKETDVAIAVRLFELLAKSDTNTVVIVSGDTDLLPAIRTARQLFPSNDICVGFPYHRVNKDLRRAASRCFKIGRQQYVSHQFPDPIRLPGGAEIHKPVEW